MSMSKQMKKEEEHDERWSKGIPDHILQLIPQRLCFSDYQAFRQVCPTWRAAVIGNGIDTKNCPPAPQPPRLLVRRFYDSLHAFSIKDQFSCVTDPEFFPSVNIADFPSVPLDQEKLCQDLEDGSFTGPFWRHTASLVCHGSIGSWLIVAAHQKCQDDNNTTVVNYILNPLSRARVMLPSQTTLPEDSFSTDTTLLFKKTVASSPPGLQDDCVVAALVGSDTLAFCRPNDTQWTLGASDFPRFGDIEIFDGKLYAVTERGNLMLMVFDLSPEDANVKRTHRVLSLCPVPFPDLLVDNNWKYPRLAKDSASNELFVVLRKMNVKEGFKVYKTNGKFDDPHGMRWEPVTDLGDRIMFLSDQSAKVISDKTLGGNCIYFAFMSGWNGGFGVYSLKDSSIKPLDFPEDCSATTSNGSGQSLWFTPSPV